MKPLDTLRVFRRSFYDEYLHRRGEATFELADAILATGDTELHPKIQHHEGRGSRRPLLIVIGTPVLVPR